MPANELKATLSMHVLHWASDSYPSQPGSSWALCLILKSRHLTKESFYQCPPSKCSIHTPAWWELIDCLRCAAEDGEISSLQRSSFRTWGLFCLGKKSTAILTSLDHGHIAEYQGGSALLVILPWEDFHQSAKCAFTLDKDSIWRCA